MQESARYPTAIRGKRMHSGAPTDHCCPLNNELGTIDVVVALARSLLD